MSKVEHKDITKKPVRGRGGKAKEDYNSLKRFGTIDILLCQNEVLSKYQVNYPTLRDFLTVYYYYLDTNTGVRPYSLIKTYNMSKGCMNHLYARLSMLIDLGLLKRVDHKYYPSDTALKELNTLSNSA